MVVLSKLATGRLVAKNVLLSDQVTGLSSSAKWSAPLKTILTGPNGKRSNDTTSVSQSKFRGDDNRQLMERAK